MNTGRLKGVGSVLACLLISTSPQAANVYWDFDDGFSPSTVVISPGDTVTWINFDPYGFDVWLSLDGYQPYLLRNLHGVNAPFPVAGTYGFQSDFGDQGVVVVNLPPTVIINYPTNNTSFAAPATFEIQASASDPPDYTGVSVEFLLGDATSTNSIGWDYDAPFTAPVTDLTAGSYTLIAMATDAYGWTGTDAVNFTVGVGATINLTAPRMVGGQFLFEVVGLTVGRTNIIQSATNLGSWTGLQTNVATSSSLTVTNSLLAGSRAFRVVQLP
jgi:plastocyanin